MKHLILLTMFLFSFTSQAATIRLVEGRLGYYDSAHFEYSFNRELGRAWITTVTSNSNYHPDMGYSHESTRVLIPAMSFDNKTGTIQMKTELRGNVICAVVKTRGRGIFKRDVIQETGDCPIKRVIETRIITYQTGVTTRQYESWDLVIE